MSERVLMKGNEAMAEAAIRAGFADQSHLTNLLFHILT